MRQTEIRAVFEIILYFALVACITFLIIHFVGQRTVVNGVSMQPTLSDGDNLIVDKLSYRFHDPDRFDIIVFPQEDGRYFIKRIIGLPGESVRIDEDGFIYINGENLQESYGKEVMRDTFKQQRDSYDFVVRVEDFRGNMVKERVWKDIVPLAIEQLPVSLNNLSDPEELSQEDPTAKLGKQYLLDGDKKGDQSFGIESWTSFYTYLAGPMAVSTPEKPGKALFIIDMMEEKLPAEVRLYGMLAVRTSWPYGPGQYETFPKWGDVWTLCYASKLPSSVTLYASQTKDDDASWVEISHFEQDRRIDNKERWCERCNENGDYLIVSRDALDLASPCFITLTCPAEGEKYRYLKVVVNEVFFAPIGFENAFMGGNDQKYVTVHELEVYTAKD